MILRSITAPEVFWYQLGFAGLGILIWIFISIVDHKILFAFLGLGFISTIILLILPVLFGNYVRGSYRWLSLGPVLLQTSKIVKPLLLIFCDNGYSKMVFRHYNYSLVYDLAPARSRVYCGLGSWGNDYDCV